MNYWTGTNIPRSQGNAFDWRNHETGFDIDAFRKKTTRPEVTTELRLAPHQLAAQALAKARHGGQYSKAKPSK